MYGADKDGAFTLNVVNAEQLGNETQLAFEVGKDIWTAKWPGQWRIEPGEKVPLYISENALYFFDTETGQTLKLASVMNKNGVETR
jgi:sn-glycerol 3-phosphate transport system ATP-binding protein